MKLQLVKQENIFYVIKKFKVKPATGYENLKNSFFFPIFL